MKMTVLDRILLLFTGLLAAWQVAVGINHAEPLPMVAYTIAFGILLVACLLLIILGFDVLESPLVVIISTIIPLSLALGLVWEHWIPLRLPCLVFVIVGFLAILVTRLLHLPGRFPSLILAVVHGIAGLVIFLLPLVWAFSGRANHAFALVGIGGALIGCGGLLLSFMRIGHPILPQVVILRLLPVLLFLMSAAFILGFSLA